MHRLVGNTKTMPNMRHQGHQSGFTLMEMVISLVVLSLLSLVMIPLMGLPLAAYTDAQRRVDLHSQMELIRAKLTDDLQNAMPGSLRVRQLGTSYFLEYLEVHAVGRYRTGAGGPGYCPAAPACAGGDALGTACAQESCLTTMGPLIVTPGSAVAVGVDYVAIASLNADPYLASPNASLTRLTLRATAGLPTYEGLRFNANRFVNGSPSNRVYIVSPVSYECNWGNGQLTRYWGYAFNPNQPTAFGAAPSALLADTLANRCIFSVSSLPGNGLRQVLAMQFTLARQSADQVREATEGFLQIGTREP